MSNLILIEFPVFISLKIWLTWGLVQWQIHKLKTLSSMQLKNSFNQVCFLSTFSVVSKQVFSDILTTKDLTQGIIKEYLSDNFRILFPISPWSMQYANNFISTSKCKLSVLIRTASQKGFYWILTIYIYIERYRILSNIIITCSLLTWVLSS